MCVFLCAWNHNFFVKQNDRLCEGFFSPSSDLLPTGDLLPMGDLLPI